MRKVTIITFGKIKSKPIQELIDHYSKLVSNRIDLKIRKLKDPGERKINSSDLNVDDTPIILSEKGKETSSREFAKLLQKKIDYEDHVTFLIGNAYGVDLDSFSNPFLLSLSQMTYPHELSLVMLLEQMFRAFDITSGGKYHK